MKGKIKKLLAASVAFAALLFSGILVACSNFEKTKLNGFDVKETVSVDYGALVTVETPIVTDDDGNFYEVMTDVSNSKGGYVVVEANSFRAWDVDGYTIKYVVRVDEGRVEEKSTKVTVTNTQSLTVSADYNEFEDTDTNIAIAPECDEEGVEYTYTVKNLKTNSEITVNTDGEQAYFVCEEKGNYEVEIVAKKGERYGSYGYTVIVREAVGKTNVEHFDEQWEEIAKYLGDERVGRYELVSGADVGLKDVYGDDAYFLRFTSTAEWLTYHISPRYDKEHYEALLAEGYDQATVYCYLVSEQNKAHTYAIRTMTSGFYERSPVTSYPNQWNEINMNLDLIHGSEVSRSFLAAFDYYKSQEGWFLCYNNEGALATRDVVTLYFSDMYITKPATITTVEGATTDYAVGDHISKDTMNEFFTSESALRYFVTFRGERTEITGDYEFKANGEYTIEALPERKDERGSAAVTLTVTDGFAASYTYLAEERIAEAASVNLNSLRATFAAVDGVTPTVSGYRVYDRYGVEYAVESNAFLAPADGAYNVEVEGTYELSGATYKTYDTVYVDVWSQATKNKFVAVEDMYSANAWAYQSTRKQTMTVGEYTVGGVTDKMFYFTKSGDNITLTVKPFYTKQYYENLLATSGTDYVVSMNAYFDGANYPDTPTMSTARSIFSDYLKCTFAKNTWTMQIAELSTFVEKYDDLVAGYELQTYNVNNKISHGYEVNSTWLDYVFYAEMASRADYVYITDMVICPIETVAETQLAERTGASVSLTSLASAFDGLNFTPSAIVKAAKNGADVTVTGDSFVVGENDGVYEVLVQGEKDDESVVLKLTVDVWSEATKNVAVAVEDMFAAGGYQYQSLQKEVLSVGEYTVGGRTEQLLQLTSGSRECSVVVVRPLHSKKYYQKYFEENIYAALYVTMDWYFDNASGKTGAVTPYYDIFNNYQQQGAQEKDAWLSGKLTLADFVEQYDEILAMYERTLNEYSTGVKYGRFVDVKGVVDPDGNMATGYVMATKFQSNRMDCAYFTPMTIELGEMTAYEGETVLVDRSTTTTITPALTAIEQGAVDYWKSQGYTVSYELVKRYSDGTPLKSGNALENCVYTITDSTEDGIYYLNAVATKGEESGVCLTKIYDIYNSTETIVEYENFKHTDSEYAIRTYWVKFATQGFTYATTNMLIQSPGALGATSVDNVAFGTGTDENTLYLLSKGTVTLANESDTQTGITDSNYYGREVGYIAYSWSSEDTQTKLDTQHAISHYQYIYTYVLPRHSKAYYQAYASSCGTFEMAYKSTNSNSDIGRMRYMYMTDIVDGKVAMAYSGNIWSSSNHDISTNITANINTVIDNYDSLAAGKVPMFIMMHMVGTTVDSYESRLYEMGFHKSTNA